MVQDPLCHILRLGCCHIKLLSRIPKALQHGLHSWKRRVLHPSLYVIIFPEYKNRLMGIMIRKIIKLLKAFRQRRSHKGLQDIQIVHLDAVAPQGILHGSRDPRHGIGQSPVQVKENMLLSHVCFLLSGRWSHG